MCTGDACGGTYSSSRYGGTTDPDGCDFNPYRMGNTTFYGPSMTVDTTSKFTVVTQFLTDDGQPKALCRNQALLRSERRRDPEFRIQYRWRDGKLDHNLLLRCPENGVQ